MRLQSLTMRQIRTHLTLRRLSLDEWKRTTKRNGTNWHRADAALRELAELRRDFAAMATRKVTR
jgi:hypothetical protein